MGPKILVARSQHPSPGAIWPYRQQRNQFKSRFWPPIFWGPIGQLWGKYGKIPKNLLKVQTWCNNFHDFIATWKSRSEVWILTSFRSFTLDPMTVLLNGSGKTQTLPWKKRKNQWEKNDPVDGSRGYIIIFSQAQIFFQSPISWCFPTSNCFYH